MQNIGLNLCVCMYIDVNICFRGHENWKEIMRVKKEILREWGGGRHGNET